MNTINTAFDGYLVATHPRPPAPPRPELAARSSDQVALSPDSAEANQGFPQWSADEQAFLKSQGSGKLTGQQYKNFMQLLDQKLGPKLPAFVALKSPQLRDEVFWDPQNNSASALQLIQVLQSRDLLATFCSHLLEGADPGQLELYRPGPLPLSDQELTQLSTLVGKARCKGPELRVLHTALLKQHGHHLKDYANTHWPEVWSQVSWEEATTHQALNLIVQLQARGVLATLTEQLLQGSSGENPTRHLATA